MDELQQRLEALERTNAALREENERLRWALRRACHDSFADGDHAYKSYIEDAKAAFAKYDSAWNGVEFYINTRSRDMYNVLEHEYQARIDKGLAGPLRPRVAHPRCQAQDQAPRHDHSPAHQPRDPFRL